MRIYISVDMEGMAGTFDWRQEDLDRSEVRRCMTRQVGWIIEGIKASKANDSIEEIAIADSHSRGDNLSYDITELDDRLHLINGPLRPQYMMPAFDSSYDMVFFAGYHSGAGKIHGSMDHTYSGGAFQRVTVNNQVMNESLLNAAYAGYYQVPVSLVIGDAALKEELHQPGGMPWVRYVVTKESLGKFAAKHRPMGVVRKETIAAVQDVLDGDKKRYKIYEFTAPIRMTVDLQSTGMADAVAMMPCVERIDGRKVELVHTDYRKVFDAVDAIAGLAKAGKSS